MVREGKLLSAKDSFFNTTVLDAGVKSICQSNSEVVSLKKLSLVRNVPHRNTSAVRDRM